MVKTDTCLSLEFAVPPHVLLLFDCNDIAFVESEMIFLLRSPRKQSLCLQALWGSFSLEINIIELRRPVREASLAAALVLYLFEHNGA